MIILIFEDFLIIELNDSLKTIPNLAKYHYSQSQEMLHFIRKIIKNAKKFLCLEWTYRFPGYDYRFAFLF